MMVNTENPNNTSNFRTVSNVTKEELIERVKAMNKQSKCPVCGAKRARNEKMYGYLKDLAEFLTKVNLDQFQDSCILCVSKHLGKAQAEYEKMLSSDDMKIRGRCRIRIIGNLNEAVDESSAFPELSAKIKAFERDFRYDGAFGDLNPIIDMVTELSLQEGAQEAKKQEVSE